MDQPPSFCYREKSSLFLIMASSSLPSLCLLIGWIAQLITNGYYPEGSTRNNWNLLTVSLCGSEVGYVCCESWCSDRIWSPLFLHWCPSALQLSQNPSPGCFCFLPHWLCLGNSDMTPVTQNAGGAAAWASLSAVWPSRHTKPAGWSQHSVLMCHTYRQGHWDEVFF